MKETDCRALEAVAGVRFERVQQRVAEVGPADASAMDRRANGGCTSISGKARRRGELDPIGTLAADQQITEDSVEKFKIIPKEQFSERICEQIVNVPDPQVDAQDERQSHRELPSADHEEFAETDQLMARLSEFVFV